MANYDQERLHQVELGRRADMAIDQGLRSYMLSVYNYMAMALALTGLVALGAYNMAVVETPAGLAFSEFGQAIYASPLKWVVMLAPLGFVFFLSFRIQKMSLTAAQTTFWAYAVDDGPVAVVDLPRLHGRKHRARPSSSTAAAVRRAVSSMATRQSATCPAWASFLFMGLIGIIIAMVVNIFLASSALQFAISVIGVLVFAGLTAYDTQRIKGMYYEGDSVAASGKKAVMGALSLYLDFINMFMFLLQFLGSQRN